MFRFNLFGRAVIALVFGTASLMACSSQKTVAAPSAPSAEPIRSTAPVPLAGSDRDAHGCIPSAGYSWCAKENACERSWELAAKKSFANTAEAYKAYCSGNSK